MTVFSTVVSADTIHGCGGFVEASSSLIKSRKATDARLDYSHVKVELRTVDELVKDSTQCASNGYYFIPVNDKGSFLIKVNGPEGRLWDPDKVPVTIDETGCTGNEDINFWFMGFTILGRVVGAVGRGSCPVKDGGPSNVNVELLSQSNDLLSSVAKSSRGSYLFKNIIPGLYELGPYYKGDNTVFDVFPPLMSVSVKHQHVTVPEKFQITRFSVGGRIVDENDMGVEGVKILVDGHERSITDKKAITSLIRLHQIAIQ